jgi:hypothetical protein
MTDDVMKGMRRMAAEGAGALIHTIDGITAAAVIPPERLPAKGALNRQRTFLL